MVRVRFAPSPTGFVHVGSLRAALYNEFFAKHHGGIFVLRIEDTDQTRYVEGAVENLLRSLKWAGIVPDEGLYLAEDGTVKERGEYGPYVQSARTALYVKYAEDLITSGNAYRCFCTAERLDEVRKSQAAAKQPMMYDKHCRSLARVDVDARVKAGEPCVIRLAIPESGETVFEDVIRDTVRFENALIDDQVLLKTDGFPTYHLANVVDDHAMEITHVIRGEEWLPSTPKHVLLYQSFGWELPKFAHLPLLLNADKSKLSKRQGDVSVEDYKDKGYLPEAMVNFIALLGWNPSADREVYAKDELVKEFDLTKINKAGAVFSVEKLDWMNGEYLKAMSANEVAFRAEPFYLESGLLMREGDALTVVATGEPAESLIVKAVALEQRRVARLAEFPTVTEYLFKDISVDPKIIAWKKSTPDVALARLVGLRDFLAGIDDAGYMDAKALEAMVIAHIASQGWTNGESLWPLRVSLSGREASPSPFEIAWVIGKKKTLARIEAAIALLS